MKKFLFLISCLLFFFNGFANNYPRDISGNYECQGRELETKAVFKCHMRLTKTNLTYASKVQCDGTEYLGTGIYDQSKHVFASVASNPEKSEETGVTLSQVSKNSQLTTLWTYLNQTTLGHTTCVKIKN